MKLNGRWIGLRSARVLLFCASCSLAGCAGAAKEFVREEADPLFEKAGASLRAGVKDAMDEAFTRLEQMLRRADEREAACRLREDETKKIHKRLAEIEQRLRAQEASVDGLVAEASAFNTSVNQQLPKIWERLRNDPKEIEELMRAEQNERAARDKEADDSFAKIKGETSTLKAKQDSLLETVKQHIRRSEGNDSDLNKRIHETHNTITAQVQKLEEKMLESRRDIVVLFSTIIGGLALIVGVYQAIRAGSRRQAFPAATAETGTAPATRAKKR